MSGHAAHAWPSAALVAVMLALGACRSQAQREADVADGDDPLAALTVLAQSRRYTAAYWLAQADASTDLWARALTYCEQQRAEHGGLRDGAKPNCGAVDVARFEHAGRTVRVRRDARARSLDSLVFRP